jgi:hypothetical protein
MSSTLIRKQTYRRTLQHKFDFKFNANCRFNLSTKSKILAQKSRNTFVSINPTIFIFKLKVYFFGQAIVMKTKQIYLHNLKYGHLK